MHSATELHPETVSVPATADLNRHAAGFKTHACWAEYKGELSFLKICTAYTAVLCEQHTEWSDYIIRSKPNFIWLYGNMHVGFFGPTRPSDQDPWSTSYDYTFKFYEDGNCTIPIRDAYDGPLQFTIDRTWGNEKDVKRVSEYLLDAEMPMRGYWIGWRKLKLDAKEGHHMGHPPPKVETHTAVPVAESHTAVPVAESHTGVPVEEPHTST
ncbi:hypothetical protein TWF481_011489 [Arthrobotrys musiformis]|uniref:Uncharacterized protein n=1 Tax=Arthrobotrys musiformis TaxID=47236 RepID=A0AAV9VYK4_9PEZI